jgi:hypothetical protein
VAAFQAVRFRFDPGYPLRGSFIKTKIEYVVSKTKPTPELFKTSFSKTILSGVTSRIKSKKEVCLFFDLPKKKVEEI